MNEDWIVQQCVADELKFEPSVDGAHIGVSVRDGVVTLSGHVESYIEKFAAENAARRVRGVKAIAQQIEVRLPFDHKTADDEIASRAVRILNWDAAVPDSQISVKVEHGTVTLNGAVDWDYQRAAAEYDIRKLTGVKGVINDITVVPKSNSEDLRAKIRAALERNAEVEASNITVSVADGTVTLRGKVKSWPEREAATRAAWSARGVRQVQDQIELTRP